MRISSQSMMCLLGDEVCWGLRYEAVNTEIAFLWVQTEACVTKAAESFLKQLEMLFESPANNDNINVGKNMRL